MQDVSRQPHVLALLLLLPMLLSGVAFGFLMIGTRARTPVLRLVFKLLAACAGLVFLACAVGFALGVVA
jgi:hypothetical protein